MSAPVPAPALPTTDSATALREDLVAQLDGELAAKAAPPLTPVNEGAPSGGWEEIGLEAPAAKKNWFQRRRSEDGTAVPIEASDGKSATCTAPRRWQGSTATRGQSERRGT